MSLVTTPTRRSEASSPHSAAIRLLLPEPTGPPTPIRRARSTGKQALPRLQVDGRGQLERDRRRRGQWAAAPGSRPRGERESRRELGDPARGDRRVQRQQLERGGRDRRGVVIERE